MMEQMDLIDLVQLRDVAREMTKKEGLPAGTSEALSRTPKPFCQL